MWQASQVIFIFFIKLPKMSGQSQDPANTNYGLGTGTGGMSTNWARADWTRAGTARTDWAWTRHGHEYGTRHGHARTGHGRAGHGRVGHGRTGYGRIVSERHGYPLVSIKATGRCVTIFWIAEYMCQCCCT